MVMKMGEKSGTGLIKHESKFGVLAQNEEKRSSVSAVMEAGIMTDNVSSDSEEVDVVRMCLRAGVRKPASIDTYLTLTQSAN